MRISALAIKNFKGINEHSVRVSFAPITMLFGPNNVGKSTIIQALHLAREVLCHNNFNPDKVEGGGDRVDLGGFKNFVHKRDLHRTVALRFEMVAGEEDDWGLPIYCEDADIMMHPDLFNQYEVILSRVKDCAFEFGLHWSQQLQMVVPSYHSIYINREHLATVDYSQSGGQLELPPLKLSAIIAGLPRIIDSNVEQTRGLPLSRTKNDEKYWTPLKVLDLVPHVLGPFIDMSDLFNAHKIQGEQYKEYSHRYEGFSNVIMKIPPNTFPNWKTRLPLQVNMDNGIENVGDLRPPEHIICDAVASSLVVGPGHVVSTFLKRLLHIGPLREVPPRNYTPQKTTVKSRWINGLAAWDTLAAAEAGELQKVNHWLDGKDSIKTGYQVEIKLLRYLSEDDHLTRVLREAILDDLDESALPLLRVFLEQPTESRLLLTNTQLGVSISPCDMGIGVSQVIPIVVAAALPKRNAIVAIEQPELHIHPAWQTVLGDLFLEAVNRDNPPMFLLETHSEHLMLRLLRRIRESNEHELPDNFPAVAPETISVIYVQANQNGGTEVIQLPITPDGDFASKWPNGFFAERAEELF